MKYEIQLPAIAGDVVPLFSIADAMARRDATAGGTDFHEPTFRGRLARYQSMLLKHVRDGRLHTCDDDGDPGEPEAIVLQRLARGGVQVLQDAAATPAKSGRKKDRVPSPYQSPNGLTVDADQTWLVNLFVNLKSLNEWGATRGDEFTVTHEGVEWIDERGVVRPTGREAVPEVASDAGATASVAAESGLTVRANDKLRAGSKSQDEDTDDDRPGLETSAVVHAFAGLRWGVKQWSDALNKNRPQWLMRHRLRGGWQGHESKQAEWCPLGIAESLFKADGRAKPVALVDLNRVFTSKPDLTPWRDKWISLKLDLAVLADDDTGQQK